MKLKVGVYPYIFHISLFVFLNSTINTRKFDLKYSYSRRGRLEGDGVENWRATGSKIGGRRGRKLEGGGGEIRRRRRGN